MGIWIVIVSGVLALGLGASLTYVALPGAIAPDLQVAYGLFDPWIMQVSAVLLVLWALLGLSGTTLAAVRARHGFGSGRPPVRRVLTFAALSGGFSGALGFAPWVVMSEEVAALKPSPHVDAVPLVLVLGWSVILVCALVVLALRKFGDGPQRIGRS